MKLADALTGFYAVLDRDDEALARALLDGGARVIQLRIKHAGAGELVRIARWLRDVCDERGAAMIVNDRLDVALAADADGVHLGQTDLPLAAARAAAEALYDLEWSRSHAHPLWFGVSTHDEAQVRAACAACADYIGFGPVFETRTKANPDPVQGLAGLRAAVAAAGAVPVVAIGGITADRVAGVHAAGAASICAISAVNEAPDVRAAATMFSRKVT